MSAVDHDDRFSPEPTQPTPESRLKELKLDIPEGIQLRLDTVFPKVTGWGWKSQIKTKCKLLSNVSHELDDLLYEGEEVLYIAKGIRYSFWEFYFMGIWAMMINHTVFVLTNLRLVMIHTDSKGRPKRTFWALFYSQIQKFKGTWNGMLNLKLKDGKKLSFSGFPKADRKTMPTIFQETLDQYRETGFSPECSQSLENLCTHCKEQVPKKVYQCPSCDATYWTPNEIGFRSFIFPSWGDFVMGHTTIAVLELIGGIFTYTIIAGLIYSGIANHRIEHFVTACFLFLTAHGIDAAVTSHIAKKGLHPKKRPV